MSATRTSSAAALMFHAPLLAALARLGGRVGKARRLANWHTVALACRVAVRGGPAAVVGEVLKRAFPVAAYARWARRHEPGPAELARQRQARFAYAPLVSVVVPTFNTPEPYLRAMLDSVGRQTYGKWELCVADASHPRQGTRELLREYGRADSRVRVTFLPDNLGIAGNSAAALAMARGEFVALLDHDDTLAPFALYEVVRALQEYPDADVLYSDEDKIDASGRRRRDHHFKPAWSPDTLRGQNYITHLAVFRRELLERVGGFRPGFDGSQDYDLILRATEQARRVVHVPRVLYHWRAHPGSAAGDNTAKRYAYEAGRRAIAEHLARIGTPGTVSHGPVLGTYQVRYAVPDTPPVSIVLTPGRNRRAAGRCAALLSRSAYRHLEVIEAHRGPVAAALNRAAVRARGEFLLFLDPDAEPLHPDWLERLLEHGQRDPVGAVGAKLLGPDGSVRHAGVVLGLTGAAGESHRHFDHASPGYACRLVTVHNVAAVAGACLLTRRSVFAELGGFDARFRRHCHDIDFCLRVRRTGRLVVWTPHARLCLRAPLRPLTADWDALAPNHDRRRLLEAWASELQAGDPYYSPNLTADWEDYTLPVGRVALPERSEGRAGSPPAATPFEDSGRATLAA